jgi:N-methylhydantoinase A
VADINITGEELRTAFEAAYWQRFGVELSEIRPVLVNLHTAVIGSASRCRLR